MIVFEEWVETPEEYFEKVMQIFLQDKQNEEKPL